MSAQNLLWVAAWERWFYNTLGFRLADLPVLIPLGVASLCIPVIAWWLQRRNWITAVTHRRIEMVWLIALTILAFSTWVIWSIDFCFRMASDRTTPLAAGYMIGIVLFSLWKFAFPQWRVGMCLAGHSLFKSMLFAVVQVTLFWGCVHVVLIFGLLIGGAAVLFVDWIGPVILIVAILLQLAIPRVFAKLSNR